MQTAWLGATDGGILYFLPVFLARLGASPSIVGLVTSGPALVGILSYLPGGIYAEKQTDMVKLTVRSSLLSRLIYPLIALLPFLLDSEHIPLAAVLLWSLAALPNAVYIPALTTILQQAVSARRMAVFNGTRWGLYSVMSAVAIASFGRLLDQAPFPGGYQIVFLASFLTALICLFFVSRIKIPAFVPQQATGGAGKGVRAYLRTAVRPLVESPGFRRYNAATLPFRLTYSMSIGLLSLYWVNDLQATDTWIGLRGMAAYAALVAGYPFWGRVTNHMGHRNLLLVSGGLLGLYPLMTALSPNVYWLLPAAILWGLMTPGIDIGFFDTLLATCPAGRLPSYSAAANMLMSVATFAGPLLGAAVAQCLSVRTALFVIGGCQLASVAFFLLLPSREQEAL